MSYYKIMAAQLLLRHVSLSRRLCMLKPHMLPIPTSVSTSTAASGTEPSNVGLMERLVSSSRPSVQPYMRLMRIDKPIGSLLLFWPCAWSLTLAAPSGQLPDVGLLGLFGLGAFLMRGAGCTINDMWDRNVDAKVKRTQSRPIASGQINLFDALVFLGGQLGLSVLLLLRLNWSTVLLASSSIGLVTMYPLMKRITYYPQLFLGLTFNWSVPVAFMAVNNSLDFRLMLPLYLSCVTWTVFYDTIYAHQDRSDDIALGMKSTAVKLGVEQTKPFLSALAVAMVSGLSVAGFSGDLAWPYYASLVALSAHLGNQVWALDPNNPANCGQTFCSNHRVGMLVFLGLCLGKVIV